MGGRDRRLAGGRGQETAEGRREVGGRGRRRKQTCLEPRRYNRLEEKRRDRQTWRLTTSREQKETSEQRRGLAPDAISCVRSLNCR